MYFYPLVERALWAAGHDPEASAQAEKTRRVKAELRAADITPGRMQRALDESRRAAENGQSTLEWIRSIQGRAHSEKLAEKVFRESRAHLEENPVEDENLWAPPSPEQAFAFLLGWKELGGSSGVAAARELQRRRGGKLPSN